MALKDDMRRLETKWQTGNAWPKSLEWLEIQNIRGWSGQRIQFAFPIVAIAGENGSGKTTVLQTAACVYKNPEGRTYFPSEFFPDTAWDQLTDVRIRFGYRQGATRLDGSIRKPTTRWLGQPQRPERRVAYTGLDRLHPIGTRVGYARIAKNRHVEESSTQFDVTRIKRLSEIMGRDYVEARFAISNIDLNREISVLKEGAMESSGFHHGTGEITMQEFLKIDVPQYSLILIDEIEAGLHPRSQRRLMRDLAVIAREKECQIIVSTHSPYILEELPLNARIYLNRNSKREKDVLPGVSPQFAMTKMDDESHPECELFVEDVRAEIWLREIISRHAPEFFQRCAIIPYGASNLGVALGLMIDRLPRPTCVFLDGDQGEAPGCVLLPGGDSPEHVVFKFLKEKNWLDVWSRIGRDLSEVADHCERAMTFANHHEWVKAAANQLRCGGDVLWQAMCSEWAKATPKTDVQSILDTIGDALTSRPA